MHRSVLMQIIKLSIAVFLFFCTLSEHEMHACSMYKLTADGKTMMGYNHDAWKTAAVIWFVNAREANEYGICLAGSRKTGHNKFAPASGMNDEGLAFATLASYHPVLEGQHIGKKSIANRDEYLADILHKCKTVDEVRNYIAAFDHSIFIEQVFFYTDKSGDYLIVEPYQLIKGNDPTYVLTNFCPSLTSHQDARKVKRYRDGEDYMEANTPIASLAYCSALSDTMSVCRSRNGDGTLLTSIFDPQNERINLYFYHDYSTTVQVNISEELAKGDRSLSIPELFPVNSEFQRLLEYKTPVTEPKIMIYLALAGCFVAALALLFLISFLRKRTKDKFNWLKLIFAGINVILFFYMYILARNVSIFYFDAPYEHYGSGLVSLSSYTPFLLLLLIFPLFYYVFHYLKSNRKSILVKSALAVNSVVYLLMLMAFGYWGFFDVLN